RPRPPAPADEVTLMEVVAANGGSSQAPRESILGALAARLPISRSAGRQLKASFVLFCLAPITVLLGTRLAHLVDDPIFGVYAVVMLAVMSVVMWTAFAAYHDPSLDRPLTAERPFVSCLVAVKNELHVVE